MAHVEPVPVDLLGPLGAAKLGEPLDGAAAEHVLVHVGGEQLHPAPTAAEVRGLVSLILWALMVMVSLKYVVFVLRADNDGEGGILALLSLVAADQVARGIKLPALVLLGVIGASLLYGDGVITPAISVLSAMEGLKLVAPDFEHFILPATIAV